MLKGIDPLLNAELLHILRAMGHGDEVALVDRNFPAASVARRLVTLDGVDIPRAGQAILSVLPLDTFVEKPALRMEVVGKPHEIPDVQREMQKVINDAEGREWPMGALERFAFYQQAKTAFAVVATGENRAYGCFLLKKGVIL
jgi:L-fucose mutarotase